MILKEYTLKPFEIFQTGGVDGFCGVQEVAKYDKVFREISKSFVSLFTEKILGWKVIAFEELKDKLHMTRQKEVDVIRKITDQDNKQHILHMEIQSHNDPEMPERMAEYYLLLHRIYGLPVHQYVIYIGEGLADMPNTLDLPRLRFDYTIISFSTLPFNLFMESENAEIQLLALLSDLRGKDPKTITNKIVQGINQSSLSFQQKLKHINQLRVLVQLRSFENILEEIMLKVSTFFKVEKDPFYKRGLHQGEMKGLRKGEMKGLRKGEIEGRRLEREKANKEIESAKLQTIEYLILELNLSDAEVAQAVQLPLAFVQEVRARLSL